MVEFKVGNRVRIYDRRYPEFWANGALGTIGSPPPEVVELAPGWQSHVRYVPTRNGFQPYYWVVVDEPRVDGDGDGPYGEAEIAAAALEHIKMH